MSNNNQIPNSLTAVGSAKPDQNAKGVGFGYKNGTPYIRSIPMTSDGKVLIEVIPVTTTIAVPIRHRLDENSRVTSFALDSTDPDTTLPITITNLGGTAPAIRIDLLEL